MRKEGKDEESKEKWRKDRGGGRVKKWEKRGRQGEPSGGKGMEVKIVHKVVH